MQTPVSHKILKQQFWLTTDRTMYWDEGKALIVSDLHFGKTGHFRKSGIAVPAAVYKEDLQRLVVQIQYFQPKELIIVGDMFHSHANRELELFLKWRTDFSEIKFRLIRGNHDVLEESWYQQAGIDLSPQSLTLQRFHFVHDIAGFYKDENIYSGKSGKRIPIFFPVIFIRVSVFRALVNNLSVFPVFILGRSMLFCRLSAASQVWL